jgi:hypothetical protein
MAADTDTLQRLALLEQRLSAVESAAANIPPAVADSGQTVSVWASYAGSVGDLVKLASGTWSAFIDSDSPSVWGVVLGVSGGWAQIAISGPRIASGTPGATYYAPTAAGAPTSTMGASDKIVEVQVAPNLRVLGASGGGGLIWPIYQESPDTSLYWWADVTDVASHLELQDDCGAQVQAIVTAAGAAKVRVIGCDGVGYKLGPDGLTKVTVTDPGTEDEEETPDTSGPIGMITITGCVDGVDKTIHVMGYVDP